MRVIIDRFEEDIAVLELDEGGRRLKAPKELFKGAREGDTAEITVLGKVNAGGEPPHEIFERLRAKSRGKLTAKPKKLPKKQQ